MSTAGIIFLSCSLLFVWSLAGYCYYRVFTAPTPDDRESGPER